MTQEQKRIAIATTCGWKDVHASEDWNAVIGTRQSPGTETYAVIPDYFNDLNAMHEAEKTLTREQWRAYFHRLDFHRLSLPDVMSHHELWPFHSTAAQRAEAFGLVMGLWKPEQTLAETNP